MSKTITAVYENGVLRPLSPLSLPEHQTVRLQILTPESISAKMVGRDTSFDEIALDFF